jgi:hypothetical protein
MPYKVQHVQQVLWHMDYIKYARAVGGTADLSPNAPKFSSSILHTIHNTQLMLYDSDLRRRMPWRPTKWGPKMPRPLPRPKHFPGAAACIAPRWARRIQTQRRLHRQQSTEAQIRAQHAPQVAARLQAFPVSEKRLIPQIRSQRARAKAVQPIILTPLAEILHPTNID